MGSDALRILDSSIEYTKNLAMLGGHKHVLKTSPSFTQYAFAVYAELDKWMKEFPDVFAGEGEPTG